MYIIYINTAKNMTAQAYESDFVESVIV